MSKFRIGDRVVAVENHPDGNSSIVIGTAGTVCAVGTTGNVGVCWDKSVKGGHNCNVDNEHCEYGHGWWVYEHQIEIEPDTSEPFEFDEDEFAKLIFGEGKLT